MNICLRIGFFSLLTTAFPVILSVSSTPEKMKLSHIVHVKNVSVRKGVKKAGKALGWAVPTFIPWSPLSPGSFPKWMQEKQIDARGFKVGADKRFITPNGSMFSTINMSRTVLRKNT